MKATGTDLPTAAWVVALSGLDRMGPARLGALLGRWEPEEAWRQVLGGAVHRDRRVVAEARRLDATLSARWRRDAAGIDVAARWAAHVAAGVGVLARGQTGFPAPLADDLEPPPVVFHQGSLSTLDRPRVAVVGTRRCTHAGRATARQLGRDLSSAGVCVVSGLARGIDGEAHSGALEAAVRGGAAPAAVVGTGLDVIYPSANTELWNRVAALGTVLSEYPLGTRPQAWRFPARNRIIAALADLVVVVESHAQGGSLHTVDAALERGRPVMAVPGPVRSPASVGTNELLVAGSGVVRDADDVLLALGLDSGAARRGWGDSCGSGSEHLDAPVGSGTFGATVLEALGWEPATVEEVAGRIDAPLVEVAVALSRMERDGLLARHGSWLERRDLPP